jgi:UDP-GlcNAc:undecaprenyl-phosphate/decaprenyl-phosphate GlcNAc-1-phosphate transferase
VPAEYWIILFVSFAASLCSTPIFRALAVRLDITDRPSARKVHTRPIPYLGGMAFFTAMSAALIYGFWAAPHVFADIHNEVIILYLAAAAFHLLGIFDDVFGLPASFKLVVQTILAVVVVYCGFSITQMTSPFGGTIPLGWLGGALSVIWILAIVNAINFIDGLDGLAAGVVFFAALANLLIALDPWQNFVCVISLVLIGATLGFLPYNFSPASIFMGDAGSLYLGVLLAGSALGSNMKGATVMSLSLPLVILALPLVDAALTVIRRGRRGKHIFKADREHLHHRLLRLGFTAKQVVLTVYGLCFLLSMAAVLASKLPRQYAFVFIFVFLASVVWGIMVFRAFENRMANNIDLNGTKRHGARD